MAAPEGETPRRGALEPYDEEQCDRIMESMYMKGPCRVVWNEELMGKYTMPGAPTILTIDTKDLLPSRSVEPSSPIQSENSGDDASGGEGEDQARPPPVDQLTTDVEWPETQSRFLRKDAPPYLLYVGKGVPIRTPPLWAGTSFALLLQCCRQRHIAKEPWGNEFAAVWVALLKHAAQVCARLGRDFNQVTIPEIVTYMGKGIPGTWVYFPKNVMSMTHEVFQAFQVSQEVLSRLPPPPERPEPKPQRVRKKRPRTQDQAAQADEMDVPGPEAVRDLQGQLDAAGERREPAPGGGDVAGADAGHPAIEEEVGAAVPGGPPAEGPPPEAPEAAAPRPLIRPPQLRLPPPPQPQPPVAEAEAEREEEAPAGRAGAEAREELPPRGQGDGSSDPLPAGLNPLAPVFVPSPKTAALLAQRPLGWVPNLVPSIKHTPIPPELTAIAGVSSPHKLPPVPRFPRRSPICVPTTEDYVDENTKVVYMGMQTYKMPPYQDVTHVWEPSTRLPLPGVAGLPTGRDTLGLRPPPASYPQVLQFMPAIIQDAFPTDESTEGAGWGEAAEAEEEKKEEEPGITTAEQEFSQAAQWCEGGAERCRCGYDFTDYDLADPIPIADCAKLCHHERAYYAALMLRHPEQVDITGKLRTAFSCAAHLKVFKASIYAEDGPGLDGYDGVDPEPATPLLPLYNVAVSNRFADLAEEEERLVNSDAAACEELGRSLRRREPGRVRPVRPARQTDRNEERTRRKMREAEDAGEARQKNKTAERRALDGINALRRIKDFLERHRNDTETLCRYVMHRQPVGHLRLILVEMLPWLRNPYTARELGPMEWLAACAFNNIRVDVIGLGLFRFSTPLNQLVGTAPYTTWVRDLTGDGDVESNPGPVSAPLTMEAVKAMKPREAWLAEKESKYDSEFSAAWDCIRRNGTPLEQPRTFMNRILSFPTTMVQADGKSIDHARTQPWSTTLYPTLIRKASAVLTLQELGENQVPINSKCAYLGHAGSSLEGNHIAGWLIEDLGVNPGHVSVAMWKGGTCVLASEKEDRLTINQTKEARWTRIVARGRTRTGTGGTTYAVRSPALVFVDGSGTITGWYAHGKTLKPDAHGAPKLEEGELRGVAIIPGRPGEFSRCIGHSYDVEGNDASGTFEYRDWGPPFQAASQDHTQATTLAAMPVVESVIRSFSELGVVTSREDILSTGYLKSDLQLYLLGEPPQPTSTLIPCLKLGLVSFWAGYFADGGRTRSCLMNGQTQVHEPTVTVDPEGVVTRLLNSSGLVTEDCGGLADPAFPFMAGRVRGRVSFHVSTDTVPPDMQMLFLPRTVMAMHSPKMLALYITMFAPWPCGNLSLLIPTCIRGSRKKELAKQVYSWFGTTLALPGELNLAIVMPSGRPGRPKDWPKAFRPCPIQPEMGSQGVHHFLPHAAIPINTLGSVGFQYVPLVDYLLSWINDFKTADVGAMYSALVRCGMWDDITRWATDGLVCFSNHCGVMLAETSNPGAEPPAPVVIEPRFDGRDPEGIPAMYKAWRDTGDRLPHIPVNVDWTDWNPPASWDLPGVQINSVNGLALGLYKFTTTEAGRAEEHRPGGEFQQAAIFAAGERRFCTWNLIHSQLRLSIQQIAGIIDGDGAYGEATLFRELFGWGSDQPRGLVGLAAAYLERGTGAPVLSGPGGNPYLCYQVPPIKWESQVVTATMAEASELVLPTLMPDSNLYIWLDSVPRDAAPFVVTGRLDEGNSSLAMPQNPRLSPPDGMSGPYLQDTNATTHVPANDAANLTEEEWWEDRLMHFLAGYQLMNFSGEKGPRGVLGAGYAPRLVLRSRDYWQKSPGMADAVYPVVSTMSTMWMAIEDGTTRSRLMLLAPADLTTWVSILNKGIGARSGGLLFHTERPHSMTLEGDRKPGPVVSNLLAAWGNARRGETKDAQPEELSGLSPLVAQSKDLPAITTSGGSAQSTASQEEPQA